MFRCFKMVFSITVLLFFSVEAKQLESDNISLDSLLALIEQNVDEKNPTEKIEKDGDFLLCSGNSNVAKANNAAVKLMKEGNFSDAVVFLEKVMQKAPLFFPFRFNVGVAYYRLNEIQKAFINLKKVESLVPEYYFVYIQLGYVCELSGNYAVALENYTKATKLNPANLEGKIMVGNLYLKRNQIERAISYYEACIKIDPLYPNALLGIAKIYYLRKLYYRSYQTLKKIETAKEFDKSYYFYCAETAYKLSKYKEAYENYQQLLKFRADKFFSTTSIKLVEHKLNIAKRFANAENDVNP